MRFNQFSYIKKDEKTMKTELEQLGFSYSFEENAKKNLEQFIRRCFFTYENTDYALSLLLADFETDFLTFCQSDRELTADVFYMLAFQLLGFVPHMDFEQVEDFRKAVDFPIRYGNLLENLYQLLNTRMKGGNTLIDSLVSQGFIEENNHYHFFNDKSLATFDTHDLIHEVVYVESLVDTDGDGLGDLIKVSILRPKTSQKIPAVMTASPYHQGVNDKESDKALQNMNVDLAVKEARTITVQEQPISRLEPSKAQRIGTSTEKLGAIGSYSLNDYLLARGFANLYVSGVGTKNSQGMMTSGDYQQVEAYKNVIDWLNGRCTAYTDHSRTVAVVADWSNGKVATTGLSYLGTMSNGLATTGVDGLEVIIAEAGISSWYNYYRENGLVTSPGGYPGEDLDSLTALTYSRDLFGGDYLRHHADYQAFFEEQQKALERNSGDYTQFWHDRNYLPHAHKVKAEVVFTHGTQDWNVKPIHVYQMFHALPSTIQKHLFLHHGEHVYMNNWQSIDFRESMNALLTKKLIGEPSSFTLPTVIWQDNQTPQHWEVLKDFGANKTLTLPLGTEEKTIQNHYPQTDYDRYSKAYQTFKEDLFTNKAQQVTIDLTLEEDLWINGPITLQLRLASSSNKGLISAQVLDLGKQKRLLSLPKVVESRSLDNGRYFAQEHLWELPFVEMPHRVISKGHLNMQNRTDLLTIENVHPQEWMDCQLRLQPTIYRMKKGDQIRIVLYTTDFEHTVRDQTDYQLSVDLSASSITIPNEI
ncbi:Xaa-Pro dipeptidyl-peptidase [Streptococcus himalayensis]|uniref:Xaa-Pro dipeptidyl-peptidase n=1 Tax=Streptococcus himalayensis TaxID=1888195 RepID=A0A917ABI9_9STRE|nr:Xaa-Pro dipeptidyl-peptidase [Streptococcus himalayensis]GGE38226.1 Xaa-Pro dipeptidyl-peptidase [Streptococcus himalayensis]